jgi:hypothetical protein
MQAAAAAAEAKVAVKAVAAEPGVRVREPHALDRVAHHRIRVPHAPSAEAQSISMTAQPSVLVTSGKQWTAVCGG